MLIGLALLMALLSRAAGGGFVKAEGWRGRIPEALFAFMIAAAVCSQFGIIAGSFALGWSYGWMETGHGTAFWMGQRPEDAQSGRKQFLSPIVDLICDQLGKPLGGSFYCWTFMGLKGLLIGLPLAPAGIMLALLWPASYWIGRKLNNAALCEYLAGASAGLAIFLFIN